jgi:GMP synthase (glutamine-hydrolysing)
MFKKLFMYFSLPNPSHLHKCTSMKKFLILQMRPEDETANGEYKAIITKGGISENDVERIRVEKLLVKDVDLSKYCAIIAGGSPFDISTPIEKKTNVQKEVENFFNRLFDKVIPNDFPFLGACSGNGLLGNYCGVNISTRYAEPIGPVQLEITKAGEKDDLLKGFPSNIQALVGHKEACDEVPKEATLLATSESCPVQMFRIKENIYATQFHPEADEEQFSLRIDIYKDYGYFPPSEVTHLKSVIHGVKVPESNDILKRFVKKYQA